MVDINTTLLALDPSKALEPILGTVNQIMGKIQILVGGIFGLYLIFFIYKVYALRKLNKRIEEISEAMKEINQRLSKLERA